MIHKNFVPYCHKINFGWKHPTRTILHIYGRHLEAQNIFWLMKAQVKKKQKSMKTANIH